jgi:hypothetical protein
LGCYKKKRWNIDEEGSVMTQAVTRWTLAAEVSGASPVHSIWGLWRTEWHWDRIFSQYFICFSLCHTTNAPYSFVNSLYAKALFVVSLETMLRTGQSEVRFLTGTSEFFHQNLQTRSGTHPLSITFERPWRAVDHPSPTCAEVKN